MSDAPITIREKLQSGRYQCLIVALGIIVWGTVIESLGLGKLPEWAYPFALGVVGNYTRGGFSGDTK